METIRAAALRVVLKCCGQDLERIVRLASAQEEHFGLSISLIALADHEPELAEALYARPLEVMTILDEATVQAQVEVCAALGSRHAEQQRGQVPAGGPQVAPAPEPPLLNVYDNVHIRLVGLPTSLDPRPMPMRPALSRLGCAQLHQLLSVNGTVVRVGPVRMWESIQVYECTRCKTQFPFKSTLEGGGTVDLPDACPNKGQQKQCSGSKFQKVSAASIYSGFQEIRLQAATACLGLGEPPASLTVVLQDELADSVRPGDSVVALGVLVPRWLSTTPGQRCSLELVLVCNNLLSCGSAQNHSRLQPLGMQLADPGAAVEPVPGDSRVAVPAELAALFEDFWDAHKGQPLLGRNKVLAGVCPGVAGLLPVKLATLLVLAGGVARRDEGGTQIRGELHLLLLGDPGTGKSQIMKWACHASPGRSVLTTGRGSSGAGLTVAAVREGNSWALEAGALVLADGGLCCIDEFDGIRSTERAVIHEAMEQQTVHVAKAGLVTSLRTRTSIIGAINPRPGTSITCSRPLTEITGLEGPLLSRFDIVLLLSDPRRPDWDKVVAGHVLARSGVVVTGGSEGGQPCTRAAPPDLKAALPEEPLLRLGPASQASDAPTSLRAAAALQESQMTIAQKVAARLAGSAAGVTLPGAPPTQATAAGRPAHSTSDACATSYVGLAQDTAAGTMSGSPARSGHHADGDTEPGGDSSAWTLGIIRSYIAWVRGRPPPVMSAEAERVLVTYYGAMRRAEDRSAARSTIRALESLIRLSQAHARLLCSGEVLLRDAVAAVMLADSSQQLLHIPGGDNVTCGRFPEDPDDDHLEQQRIVLTALGLTHLLPPPPSMLPAPPPANWG